MSSITDYFERMHRREYENPTSHRFTVAGGILFLLAGIAVEIWTHDLTRALSLAAIGLGMVLYGISNVRLRESRWYWLPFATGIVLWFTAIYWMVRPIFVG
ncbi:hypothetical protein ACFPT7_04505 [Acidicapsa dinghuensis]|uniref:Uncharacterized protein n=1 Tax=Acidicapsa dinghuensis TaxID=2218256 RepID=A0ABW1ECF4_9BACT|nr:hypothetical protein [Acidicapsa dinghuensis]